MKLDLQISQRLLFSQRMQKSLKLLSLSNEELLEAIQQELLENPLLETEESQAFSAQINESFRPYDYVETVSKEKKNFNENEFLKTENLKEKAHWKDQLLKQSRLSFFSEELKQDIELLISYLDERAYLRVDIEDLAFKKRISKQRIEKALSVLQSFEPLGVGARNLEECLLIQVRHKGLKNPDLEKLISHYLSFLKDKKYPYIAGELNISLKKLKKLCKELEKLNPYPLTWVSSEPTVFIRPDMYIYKQNSDFHVLFNMENLPSLRFSRSYLSQIRKNRAFSKKDRQYLTEKSRSAQLFIHALEHRQTQIKKLGFFLIKYQRDFFNEGLDFLRPLKMTTLAEKMEMSVSTISRTVNNKYVHTPHGLLPLRSFFLTSAGGSFIESSFSVWQIKKALQKWISVEKKPFSDEELRKKVEKHFGLSLSRRRIHQLRASLNIPSARIRRLKFLYSQ